MKTTRTLRAAVSALALVAAGVASAQTTSLLNVSYDVSREFYKDVNTAFVAHYKKPPAKTSRLTNRTRAPAHRPAPWPMA